MPSIFRLQNLELISARGQKESLLATLGLAEGYDIDHQLQTVRDKIKTPRASETETETETELTVAAQESALTIEELRKRESNLLFLKKLDEAIALLEKQTSTKPNDYFNILDVESDPITSVSYTFPGQKPMKYERAKLTSDEEPEVAFRSKQILRIDNPKLADVTVHFRQGGSFTRHANGDISISVKNPKFDASGKTRVHTKDFDTKQLFSFTDQILLDYVNQKNSDTSSTIPINLNFESIPDSSKDEWKKRTLANIIYKYTREGEKHGAQDRFNEIISSLIAGGSMTTDDMNRYSIKLNQAYTYDLKGFDEYRKVSNEERIEKVTKQFLSDTDLSDVDSEGFRTLKNVGSSVFNFTASRLKTLVNFGLGVLQSGSRVSDATFMFNRKELDQAMLDNFKALFRDVKDKKQPGNAEEVRNEWGKIPAYKRLKDSGVTDKQLFDTIRLKLTNEPAETPRSAPHP